MRTYVHIKYQITEYKDEEMTRFSLKIENKLPVNDRSKSCKERSCGCIATVNNQELK